MNKSNMKGLVLEGGGAKGAFQIGAYKALKELGIKFDPSGLHGAKVDAMLTLEVYRKLLEYLSEPPHIDRVPL